MKNVILLGKGKLAIEIAQWFLERPGEYRIQWVVPDVPEPEWTDSLINFAAGKRLPLIESGNYADIPELNDDYWKADLVISVFYKKIIKQWFIDKCHKILNIHLAPLPKYRGVRSINWALKNGELEHGVTIHEITAGIDEGPILSQVKFSIYPEFEEVQDVYNRALEYAFLCFRHTMVRLDKIAPRPQDHRLATYYSEKDTKRLGERMTFTKELSRKQWEIEGMKE